MSRLSTGAKTNTLSPALPINNRVFDQLRLYLRQNQFTILAAAPSVGKSVFARNLVVKTPVDSLFFSADSDKYTVKVSVAACLTGTDLATVEKQLDNPAWDQYYMDLFKAVDHVDWDYNTDLDLEYIENKMLAFSELMGDFPKLVVIDNLSDMLSDEGGDIYIELRYICRELRALARKTECHIIALHHLTGEYEDGLKAVSLKALEGKVGKVPENVLGLYWSDSSQQKVAMTVPKARGTKRGMTVAVDMDYSQARIGDFR